MLSTEWCWATMLATEHNDVMAQHNIGNSRQWRGGTAQWWLLWAMYCGGWQWRSWVVPDELWRRSTSLHSVLRFSQYLRNRPLSRIRSNNLRIHSFLCWPSLIRLHQRMAVGYQMVAYIPRCRMEWWRYANHSQERRHKIGTYLLSTGQTRTRHSRTHALPVARFRSIKCQRRRNLCSLLRRFPWNLQVCKR